MGGNRAPPETSGKHPHRLDLNALQHAREDARQRLRQESSQPRRSKRARDAAGRWDGRASKAAAREEQYQLKDSYGGGRNRDACDADGHPSDKHKKEGREWDGRKGDHRSLSTAPETPLDVRLGFTCTAQMDTPTKPK